MSSYPSARSAEGFVIFLKKRYKMSMEIKLEPAIDFGRMPIANAFLSPDEFADEYFYPMVVGYDRATQAIGLVHRVPPEKMFHGQYAFFSSTSKGMQKHFRETAQKLKPYAGDGVVVEMGSNDGIMLEAWKELGVRAVGVEPSANVAAVSRGRGHWVIERFMDDRAADEILGAGSVSLVYGANVSCHIEDFVHYARLVARLVGDTGIFVFEDPYFLDIVEKTSYDQIYDEHVWYFTVSFINNVFAPLGLHVFDCEHLPVHGGELRMYVGRRDKYPAKPAVADWLGRESDLEGKLARLAENIKTSKTALRDLLYGFQKEGRKIAGFGASSKGVIVCNWCELGPDVIPYITDNTPIKQDKYYPGVHIPIVPQEEFAKRKPDVAVLFAWNHLKEIDESQAWFRRGGRKWVTHVPIPRMI